MDPAIAASADTDHHIIHRQWRHQSNDKASHNADGESGITSEATPADPLLGDQRITGPEGRTAALCNRRFLLRVGPGLLLITFAIGFDITFVSTNYSRRFASDFNELSNAVWIVLAGSITETATQPLYAHIAQLRGRRFATLVGIAAVTLGFLLWRVNHNNSYPVDVITDGYSALSKTLWELTVSRVIVGCGSSGLQLLIVIVLNDLLRLHDLQLWRSIAIITQTCAFMLGGPLGSVMMEISSWQITFGIECGFMILVGTVIYLTLYMPPGTLSSTRFSVKRIDYAGTIILFAAVAVPLFAINLGGNILPWNDPILIALVATTPLLFVILFYFESRFAINPIIPVKLVRSSAAIAVIICAFPVVFSFNQVVYQFSLYVEACSFDQDSHSSDWALSLIFLGRPIGAVFVGWCIRRFLKVKLLLQTNLAVSCLVFLFYALGYIRPKDLRYSPLSIILGFNIGISEGCLLIALLSVVGKDDQPALYALFDLALALAGDLGIAISLALYRYLAQRKLRMLLGDSAESEYIIKHSLNSLEYVRNLPNILKHSVVHSIISSIENVFLLSCGAIVVSFIATFYMREMLEDQPESQNSEPEE